MNQYQNNWLLKQHAFSELDHLTFLQKMIFAVDLKKCLLSPTQSLKFPGLEIDSKKMILALPELKVKKLILKCKILFANSKATLSEEGGLINILYS